MPDVVLRAMKARRKERQAQVITATKQIARVLGSVGARGRDSLEAIGIDEWERLIGSIIE